MGAGPNLLKMRSHPTVRTWTTSIWLSAKEMLVGVQKSNNARLAGSDAGGGSFPLLVSYGAFVSPTGPKSKWHGLP